MMGCNGQNKTIKANNNNCNRRIVIDKSKVDKSWETLNKQYYSSIQTGNPNNCTHDHIYIDVMALEKAKLYSTWLKKYGTKVCYEETSDYIECEHLITDLKDIETLEKTVTFDTKTLDEIEKKIISLGGNFGSYSRYIKFYKDSSSKLDIKLEGPFNPNANYYSTPLIKSIKDNNNLTASTKFIFKEIGGYIYFGVEINPGQYNYYNFSHIPPITGKAVTSPI